MAYTNTDTNMTTSSALSAGMQTYYNRELLRTFEPNLVHLQFGDEHRMPPHSGLVMNMRKLIPLETNTKALSEGDPGESVMLAETEVTVQLRAVRRIRALHGQARSDAFGHGHHAPHEAVWRRGRAEHRRGGARGAGEVRKRDLRGRQGKPRRTDGGGQADHRELRKAVKTLKKNHAQTFGGYYVAIIGPDTMYDLQEDEAFVKVSQYQDKENIYTGEVGRLFGVRLVETTEAKIFEGAGASGADVASVIVLGQYAYGVTSLKGAKPRVIVKPAGSAGTADPLDQISTVGWKMDGFGAKLLQPEYAVRIECGFSA